MNLKDKKWQYWWEEWVKPILYAFIIVFCFIRPFIIQPFKIPSTSMVPTFIPGDKIFVNKFIYGARIPFTNVRLPKLREPERGDIIVFRSPVEKIFLIKRLIGKPGDVIEIRNRHLWIDGKPVNGPPILRENVYYNSGEYGAPGKPVKVPADSYYFLGDNSANSRDSRFWGFVPAKNVAGRVFVIWWPIKRMRIIK